MSEAPVAAEGGGEPAAAPAARTGWGTFRSVLLQLAIFYFISSYFRGGKQTAAPPTNPDGTPSLVGRNLFFKDEKLVCTCRVPKDYDDYGVSGGTDY